MIPFFARMPPCASVLVLFFLELGTVVDSHAQRGDGHHG